MIRCESSFESWQFFFQDSYEAVEPIGGINQLHLTRRFSGFRLDSTQM